MSLLLVGAVASAYYFYNRSLQDKAALLQFTQQQVQEKAKNLPVLENILPNLGPWRSMYASSTDYEKSLVQGYLKAYPAFVEAIEYEDNGSSPESRVNIRYYDEKTVVIETLWWKGPVLCIYDVRTFEQIGNPNDCFYSPYNEFKDYIIKISDKEIYYYKKGSMAFRLLNEAELRLPNETYEAVNGAGGLGGDIKFNEATKELKISVFDSRYSVNGSSTRKIRTASFVLP